MEVLETVPQADDDREKRLLVMQARRFCTLNILHLDLVMASIRIFRSRHNA